MPAFLLAIALQVDASTLEKPTTTSPCLGQPIAACLDQIAINYQFNRDEIATSLARMDRRDVNGKLVTDQRHLTVFAWKGSLDQSTLFSIDLTQTNIVSHMSLGLIRSPEFRSTEEDYDSSGLLEAMSLAFPQSCWNGSKTELYRWFENTVKPKIVREPEKTEFDQYGARTSLFRHSSWITYCGAQVKYSGSSGTDTDRITYDNPHGYSELFTIDVKQLP